MRNDDQPPQRLKNFTSAVVIVNQGILLMKSCM